MAGLVVALLLGLLWWNASGEMNETEIAAPPSAAPPSVAPPATLAGPSNGPTGIADDRRFGPMSIMRNANGFTLTGEFPDAKTKASLVDSIGQAMPGAKIVDQLTVNPAVRAPEFAALGTLFGTALDISGFSSTLMGDTLTLAGRAPAVDVKAAAAAAAGVAWPNVKIVNDIQVDPTAVAPAPQKPGG